jgi:transcriptional regulator GlxA family with amidase domain
VAGGCTKRLVAIHSRGGEPQFSTQHVPASPAHPRLAKAQAYVLDHLAEAFPVDRLAQVAGVSTRSLARLFSAELGLTPHQFVESLRVNQARNLLEDTRQPLKVIAYDCGFGSAEQMRLAFLRRLGASPARYRQSRSTYGLRSAGQCAGAAR